MSKTDPKLAVAKADATVVDLMSAVKEELKGLKLITETQYKTGSDGRVDGFSKSIQEETDIQTLVKMHSSVHGRFNAYNASTERLSSLIGGNFAVPVFKINNASFETLESDIVLRIQVLSVKERKEELEKLLDEAKTFLTEKDKLKLFQKKMASFLGTQVEGEEAEDAEIV